MFLDSKPEACSMFCVRVCDPVRVVRVCVCFWFVGGSASLDFCCLCCRFVVEDSACL